MLHLNIRETLEEPGLNDMLPKFLKQKCFSLPHLIMSTVSKIDDHSFEKWKTNPEEAHAGGGGWILFLCYFCVSKKWFTITCGNEKHLFLALWKHLIQSGFFPCSTHLK